jgi:CotS family spore coat protein
VAEKMSEVFEMYDVRLDHIGRGRGAMLLQTDKGVRQIRATTAGEKRLQAEYDFKEHMYLAGFPHIDRLVKNVEDELITYDRYGNPFVMRMFFDGREMGVSNKNEIMLAVDNLVALHRAGRTVWQEVDRDMQIREKNDVKRRNREMKRVHNYIVKQSPKREFESLFMQAFPYFYEQGLNCEQAEAGTAGESEHMGYCHGTYNHHSVLVCGTADARYIATINFEKYHIGNQLQDLYYFIRKTVEKNGYAFALLTAILERYQQGIPLQQMDVAYICGLYRYPEKFYKLSNQYMNGSKTRISPKMVEKLNRIMEEEEKKQTLLEKLSSYNISKK